MVRHYHGAHPVVPPFTGYPICASIADSDLLTPSSKVPTSRRICHPNSGAFTQTCCSTYGPSSGAIPPTRIRLPPTWTRIRPGVLGPATSPAGHALTNSIRSRSQHNKDDTQTHRVPSQDTPRNHRPPQTTTQPAGHSTTRIWRSERTTLPKPPRHQHPGGTTHMRRAFLTCRSLRTKSAARPTQMGLTRLGRSPPKPAAPYGPGLSTARTPTQTVMI